MFKNFCRKTWKPAILTLILLALVATSTVLGNFTAQDKTLDNVFTIGRVDVAYAAGTPDYTCNGVNDDVEFQAALNALPAGGGQISILAGTYNLSNTVLRAIDNVTIQGVGLSTVLTNDNATPIFSAGLQSDWVFRDFKTDLGGLTYTSSIWWTLENVVDGTDYYSYYTYSDATAWNIPTGRSIAFVLAPSDAIDAVKAQADEVLPGADDDSVINPYIAAADGGIVFIAAGTVYYDDDIIVDDATLMGAGSGTRDGYGTVFIPVGNTDTIRVENTGKFKSASVFPSSTFTGVGVTVYPVSVDATNCRIDQSNDVLDDILVRKASYNTVVSSEVIGGNVISGTNTVTLGASASGVNDAYNGMYVNLNDAVNVETRRVTDYDGATKVATLASNWTNNYLIATPTNYIVFSMVGTGIQFKSVSTASYNNYIELSNFGGVTVSGYLDCGVEFYVDETLGHDAYINGNVYDSITVISCKTLVRVNTITAGSECNGNMIHELILQAGGQTVTGLDATAALGQFYSNQMLAKLWDWGYDDLEYGIDLGVNALQNYIVLNGGYTNNIQDNGYRNHITLPLPQDTNTIYVSEYGQYRSLKTALAYAQSMAPTANNRWQIYVLDDITETSSVIAYSHVDVTFLGGWLTVDITGQRPVDINGATDATWKGMKLITQGATGLNSAVEFRNAVDNTFVLEYFEIINNSTNNYSMGISLYSGNPEPTIRYGTVTGGDSTNCIAFYHNSTGSPLITDVDFIGRNTNNSDALQITAAAAAGNIGEFHRCLFKQTAAGKAVNCGAAITLVPLYNCTFEGTLTNVTSLADIAYTCTYSADYGGAFAAFTPPTGHEGMIVFAEDTNGAGARRIYIYISSAWRYIAVS